eukprot:COSAG02_NODE_805_length_16972_cov_36.668287_2_plen_105_part_00
MNESLHYRPDLLLSWRVAVLYVLRTLVESDIPLNSGCLKPVELVIPEGSMLRPQYPAAVVAGNVETSQNITDALYGALGRLAACQGSMVRNVHYVVLAFYRAEK